MILDSFCTSLIELNVTVCERIDPLFSAAFGSFWRPEIYLQYQLFIFALGILFFATVEGARRAGALLATLIAVISSVLILGSEPSYFTACWLPFFLGSFCLYCRSRSIVAGFGVVLFALLLLANTGALAPFSLFVGFGYLLCRGIAITRFALLAALLVTLVAFIQLPASNFPSYPPGARVSPLSPLTVSQPVILGGPEHRLNPVIFGNYQHAAKIVALNTLIVGVAVGVISLAFRCGLVTAIPFIALFLFFLCESTFSTSINYSPFQSFRRVIPGLGLEMLPWSLTLSVLTPAFVSLGRKLSARASTVLFGALLSIFVILLTIFPPSLRLAMLSISAPRQNIVSATDRIAFSPSAFVARYSGAWSIEPGIAANRADVRLLSQPEDFVWAASASIHNENAILALDGNEATRWSTGRAQGVGDTFSITFDREVEVIRAELSVRNTPTDFPRGLRVESSPDSHEFATIADFDDWLGPLRWTDSDFPYFGPPHDVTIQFPTVTRLRTLRFVLLAGDPLFDWSIGELRLYAPTTAATDTAKISPNK